jgi:hypothetical protein
VHAGLGLELQVQWQQIESPVDGKLQVKLGSRLVLDSICLAVLALQLLHFMLEVLYLL